MPARLCPSPLKNRLLVIGLQAMARTLLNEVLRERSGLIEMQLAQIVDPNGLAHNRTVHLAEHKRMMVKWSATQTNDIFEGD